MSERRAQTTRQERVDCTLQVHNEETKSLGRWPSLKELMEITGIGNVEQQDICREHGLPLTDGRTVRAR